MDDDDVGTNWKHIAEEIKKSKEQTTSGESLVTNIQVAVRVRPLNSKESGQKSIVKIQESTVIMDEDGSDESDIKRRSSSGALAASSAPATFTYDHAFDEDKSQADIFRIFGRDMVKDAILGFNCSVFAYGQTSSGKSYTMAGSDDQKGLIPRICECLFYGIDVMSAEMKSFRIQASYYEIYNEKVYDLLNPQLLPFADHDEDGMAKRKALNVREDKKVGVFVDGLHHADVEDVDGANAIMARGLRERTVQATKMNSVSSRSHAIFVLSIAQTLTTDETNLSPGSPKPTKSSPNEITKKKIPKPSSKFSKFRKEKKKELQAVTVISSPKSGGDKAGQMNMRSKLSLIDLAGSERAKTSGAEGGRLTESNNINLSLSTLGRCISALVKKAKSSANKSLVIPFRDSVLTWLLRESLAGNARTRMMASISPAQANAKETLSTLRYARSAKLITTKATVVADPKEQRILFLANEVSRLKTELLAFQSSSMEMHMLSRENFLSSDTLGGGSNNLSIDPSQKAWMSMSRNGASRTAARYHTPSGNSGGDGDGSMDSLGNSIDGPPSSEHSHLRPRSLAQTGAVMNELMHELDLLTNEDHQAATTDTLAANHDDLYIPPETLDLQQVRNAWRRNPHDESVPFAVISNLNADSLLTGKLLLQLNIGGVLKVGRPGIEPKQDLELEAEGIAAQHCIIEYLDAPLVPTPTTTEHNDSFAAQSVSFLNDTNSFDSTQNRTSSTESLMVGTPSASTPQAYITPLMKLKSRQQSNQFRLSFSNDDDDDDGRDDDDDDEGVEEDDMAEVHVNGARLLGKQALYHGDRLVFGACSYAGFFVESPKVLKAKLEQHQLELNANKQLNNNDDEKDSSLDLVYELNRFDKKIDHVSYTEALHEVLRASVAKANSLRRTLSMAPRLSSSSVAGQNNRNSPPPYDPRNRSPDRRGQEVSADLLSTHGAVRQTNFISRELGLGIVFSIVLKSDVDSRVALSDTDIDSLLSWRNVTVNIEAVCYLPSEESSSESDYQLEEGSQVGKLKALTEPHHLLTCGADQFSDIADAFSEARSLLKRCSRRVTNLISDSKNKSRSRKVKQALLDEEDEDESEKDSFAQLLKQQQEEKTRDASHTSPTASYLTSPISPRTHLNFDVHEDDEAPSRIVLSQRVDSIAEEDEEGGSREGSDEPVKGSQVKREEEEDVNLGSPLNVRNHSDVPVNEEDGVLRKFGGGGGGRSVSRSMNRAGSMEAGEGGHTIWSLASPHSSNSIGRFDRHSFSAGRPDVDAALLDKDGNYFHQHQQDDEEDLMLRSPSAARTFHQNKLRKKANILRRVFDGLFEVDVKDDGKVCYREASSTFSSNHGNDVKQLVPSQVALGLCLLNMMRPTKDLKKRIREAERFMKVHNHSYQSSSSSPPPSPLLSPISNTGGNKVTMLQNYESFIHGVIEHIRLCIIGAVLEDIVYELTESSPTVLRAFLTRSSLSSVSDERGESHDRNSRSRSRRQTLNLEQTTDVVGGGGDVRMSNLAYSQMEERALRAERILEEERLRNERMSQVYEKLQTATLDRFIGNTSSTSSSSSSSTFLLNFKQRDHIKAKNALALVVTNKNKTTELKTFISELELKRIEKLKELNNLMKKQIQETNSTLNFENEISSSIQSLSELDLKIETLAIELNKILEFKASAAETLYSLEPPAFTRDSSPILPPPSSPSSYSPVITSPSVMTNRLSKLKFKRKVSQNDIYRSTSMAGVATVNHTGNVSRSPATSPPPIDAEVKEFEGKGTYF